MIHAALAELAADDAIEHSDAAGMELDELEGGHGHVATVDVGAPAAPASAFWAA